VNECARPIGKQDLDLRAVDDPEDDSTPERRMIDDLTDHPSPARRVGLSGTRTQRTTDRLHESRRIKGRPATETSARTARRWPRAVIAAPSACISLASVAIGRQINASSAIAGEGIVSASLDRAELYLRPAGSSSERTTALDPALDPVHTML
jgi:hypothetical protein